MDRAARAISYLLSPSGVAFLVLSSAVATGRGEPLWTVVLVLGLFCVLPTGLMLALASRYHLDDVFDPPSAARQLLLITGTIGYLVGYVVMSSLPETSQWRWLGLTFAAGAGSVAVIDRWWKISIHNTAAGGGAVLLTGMVAGDLWPLWWALPVIVGWARWHQRAHDPAQLVAGAVLGAAVAQLSRGWCG